MNRRRFFRSAAGAGLLGAVTAREQQAAETAAKAVRGLPTPKIKDISVIETEPSGVRLSVVKITTDQDGLTGYGCATFTQRADLVKPAVERYLKPFLVGKPADRIEDTWQSCYDSSYWKNGPVLNNAISGVDQALWDIKGKQAGLPVYQLVGGKVREAADVYGHAAGADYMQTVEQAKTFIARGYRHVRVQVGVPGMAGYGSSRSNVPVRGALHSGEVFESGPYIRRALKLFETCRHELGDEIELLHDVHERVTPREAVQFAKLAEPYRLFYLEDVLSPEDIEYFRQIRQQCSTSIAMGELFNSPHEWTPLIKDRLIDFIRIHVSQAGGFTPCRKIAAFAEMFGVRTAWHGPGDVSPVGHAAHLTLDLVCTNFGIQEYSPFSERSNQIFKGSPVLKEGYLYINEAPGWGIEVDEKLAAEFPFGAGEQGERKRLNGGWGEVRKRDGQVIKQ